MYLAQLYLRLARAGSTPAAPRQPAQLTNDANERGSEPWGSSPLATLTRPTRPASATPRSSRRSSTASPQAMSPKQRALGADRRDDRDAPAGRQILNGVPKLRRVGYYVGRQHAQQPRSPNRGSLAARAISPYRVSPVHCRAPCLAPTSDSWHDRGLFRHRFEPLNTAGQPVVPEIGNGVARPDRSATTSPKQRALRADR